MLYGGRSSGKTWQVSKALIQQAHKESLRVICVREHQKSLKDSAKPALEGWIKRLRLGRYYTIYNDAIKHSNGSLFTFHGASKSSEEDIKGWEGAQRTWFEEAHRMSKRSRDLIYPTIFRRDDSEMWLTFNPELRTDPVYEDFVSGDWAKDNRYVQMVNYTDNPWFPAGEEELRREYEKNDPLTYPWMWLGLPNDGDAETQVLTYGILKQCVEAHRDGLAPSRDVAPLCDSGFDIATGGKNKCANVVRVGPTIELIDEWPGVPGYLLPAVRRVDENGKEFNLQTVWYDAGGGDTARGTFEQLEHEYSVRPIHFGGKVGGPTKNYEPRSTNEQTFKSRNIQMAYALRNRANRTVKLLKNEVPVDVSDCLFINPDCGEKRGIGLEHFLGQMVQPRKTNNKLTGKLQIDKRDEEQDEDSPDLFDAGCLSFARDSVDGLRAYA